MAVKLRLRRMGKKKQPIYKIVAADVRSPRDGRFLEAIGLYNPLTNPHSVEIKEERVLHWLNNGAQPTKTVKSLLRQKGITLKHELIKKGVEEDKIESKLSEWEKVKETKLKAKSTKKKISRKAKVKQEAPEESSDAESVEASEDKQENKKSVAENAPEVKGATSEENEEAKE